MRLTEIVLHNFRPYSTETRIPVGDFTALIGKNDVGKSCILEALSIFFESGTVSIERDDATKGSGKDEVVIGCVFSDLPDSVVIDEKASTSLADEHLLTQEGLLEIRQIYDCSLKTVKGSPYAWAWHPTSKGYEDLLLLKNVDLKKRYESLGITDTTVNKSVNKTMRKAIWDHCPDLQPHYQLIPLDKEDAKKLWGAIQAQFPVFALFQSDRASRDEDSEVQDPMKAAVVEALKSQQALLDQLKEAVRVQTTEVATRTLTKLQEWDPELAQELSPNFKAEPKWDQIFKMMLTSDDEIPINKRGSGVRRLVLLSFFRAEAEKRRESSPGQSLIYAIEEPETSQHPNYQRLLIEALLDLSDHNCQILVTTHNPALAAFVPVEDIRYLSKQDGLLQIERGTDQILESVARTLGVLPDNRICALVCAEGPTDVDFLCHASHEYHKQDNSIMDLSTDRSIAFVTLGGSNLQQWIDRRYLKGFGRPEIHLYDRGSGETPDHQGHLEQLQADGEDGMNTDKREIENYYHRDAISQIFTNISIPEFSPLDKVPEIVAKLCHEANGSQKQWSDLNDDERDSKIGKVKKRFVRDVLPLMTTERLRESDSEGTIVKFLRKVAEAKTVYASRLDQ